MNIVLIAFYIKYEGDWDKIYNALERKEPVTIKTIEEVEKKVEKDIEAGNGYKTIIDKDYPDELKDVWKPPFVVREKDKYEVNKTEFGSFVVFTDAEYKNNKNLTSHITKTT